MSFQIFEKNSGESSQNNKEGRRDFDKDGADEYESKDDSGCFVNDGLLHKLQHGVKNENTYADPNACKGMLDPCK